jgi:D-sedoheptulose 7-phosphate isomerase
VSERTAKEYLEESAAVLAEMVGGGLPPLVSRAGELLAGTLRRGRTVLFCGNGGSAADAQHLAAELVGRLDASSERPPLAGLALTTDTSALTALSNDYGYEEVFARQVRAHGRPGDCLVCISTSGSSANVVRAAEAATALGMSVIALLGEAPSPLDDMADVALHVPASSSALVQQGHAVLGHLLCRLAEDGVRDGDDARPGDEVLREGSRSRATRTSSTSISRSPGSAAGP